MNILHLLSEFDSYDAVSGAADLANHLAAEDYPSIIASSLEHQAFGPDKLINVEYFKLPRFETNIKNFAAAYKILKGVIKTEKIDLLHSYSPLSSWLAYLVCRHTDKLQVTTCNKFYSKNIFNYSLVLSKIVVVHSEAVGKHLIGNFNLPRERLRFIKPSLCLEDFNFQDVDQRSKTDFNIAVISPRVVIEEYEYFLKAMVKAIRIIPHIKICIVFYRSQLKQNIKDDLQVWLRRLGLTNYVRFFEVFDLRPDFLSQFNLLMFSAFQESATLRPILEAQAYGIPVIATRVGGVAEIIDDNKTGILVSPRDNSSLTNAIVDILKDFSRAREIACAARKRLKEEFDLTKNKMDFTAAYKEAKDRKKILVINIGRTENVISSIPALRILREQLPEYQITSLVNSTLRCLLRRCPYIDEFIVYDCEYKHKGLPGFIYILKLLIIERFDVVFDFSNSFKTHLLSYLSLANKRYGYSNNIVSRFLINKGVKKTAKSSNLEIDKLAILSPLGIDSGDRKLELWPSEEDIEFADNFLRDNWVGKEKVVGMDISAKRRFFPDPSTSDYLAYLCDKLANQQIRVILFGSKEDSDLRDDLAKKIKSKPILALGDISRMQSACIIKKCNLYISLHQESLYLALAMRIPSIVILGANKNFDFSQYKNIVVLAAKDLGINMDSGNKRKRPTHKDCVIEAVNRLIQVK